MCYVEHRMGHCRGAMLSIWRISRLQNPGTTFLLLNTRGYWDAEMQKVESTEAEVQWDLQDTGLLHSSQHQLLHAFKIQPLYLKKL